VVICLECGANDLHMVQLMPLPPHQFLLPVPHHLIFYRPMLLESLSREFIVALPWELLFTDDLVVIAERLFEWKDYVENRGMTVNINITKVMISGEWQKVM